MASLALGLAGAGIGSFFGPLGTSLGWSAGAMLGARLGRKSQQSPQMKDLRVQVSEYGQPIPIGFGTIRIAGWLEWAADKVPHKHKQGGKGGPKVTTTTYTCSFAIGLLETSFLDHAGVLVNNPILGILRIWANGRLVLGEGSPAGALPITVYYGTEEQLPDPTIESYEGAGQVSANRGKAYVVFTDLELAPYGDAIPNFTFEVMASGELTLGYKYRWWLDWDFPVNGSAYSSSDLNGVEPTADGLLRLHRYRAGKDYGPATGTGADDTIYYDQRTYDLQGHLLATEPQKLNVFPSTVVGVRGAANGGIGFVGYQTGGGSFSAWLKDGVVTAGNLPEILIFADPVYWNGFVYAAGRLTRPDADVYIRRWPAPDGSVYPPGTPDLVGINADEYRTGYPAGSAHHADYGKIMVGDDGYLYWLVGYYAGGGDGTRLFKLDADLNLVDMWWSGSGADLPNSSLSVAIYRGHIVNYQGSGVVGIGAPAFVARRLNGDGTTTFVAEGLANVITQVYYIGGGLAAVRDGIVELGSGTITLAEMVANVSRHVGYADDEIDVSQLTDMVRGACISQRTSGRAAIEGWQPAYQFGAVESNFAVKFVKWGGEVSTIIPDADLGARESGTEPVEPIKRTLTGDKDLPRVVECVFLNKGMDYQEGMQYWEGPARSDVHVALTMALVFTDTEGKAIAENIGVNALVERNRFSFPLPRKYADLEPTDVIAINEQAIRIVSKDEQGYTHIQFEGISTRIGEWIVAPVAPQTEYVPQAPPTTVRTDLLLLDTALARDTDFELGFNAAVAGAMAGSWPGAGLYKSIDGGATYDLLAAMVSADTFGVATSVLGDFGGGNIVDELDTFTVRLTPGSGELASTNYLGLINGANLFALGTAAAGYELAQFRVATLLAVSSGGSKTYQLRGLLRGRRGTEWALASHAVNDNFVLLPAHNVDGAVAELGASRLYKAVTAGSTLSSASAVPFTNNGIALKPYAPVLLGGGRNAAGDIILNWTRRTRIGGSWANNVDVPLGESMEFYQVVIYASSAYAAIKNQNDDAPTTFTYTAAQQSADFGAPQATLHWSVKQLGSYGWGYEARGTT